MNALGPLGYACLIATALSFTAINGNGVAPKASQYCSGGDIGCRSILAGSPVAQDMFSSNEDDLIVEAPPSTKDELLVEPFLPNGNEVPVEAPPSTRDELLVEPYLPSANDVAYEPLLSAGVETFGDVVVDFNVSHAGSGNFDSGSDVVFDGPFFGAESSAFGDVVLREDLSNGGADGPYFPSVGETTFGGGLFGTGSSGVVLSDSSGD